MIRLRISRLAPPLAALLLGCTALTGPAQAGWLFGGDDDAKPAPQSSVQASAQTNPPGKPATDIEGNVQQAKMLRLAGHYQEAIHRLSQLMLVAADDARVVGEYGKTLTQMGRAQDALDFLTRARQLDPGDWSICSALGVAYDELGDQNQARAAYEQALKLKPDEPSVLNNYALSRLLAHDPAGAHALAARISAAGGTIDPKIARNLAMIEDMAPARNQPVKETAKEPAKEPVKEAIKETPKDSAPKAAPLAPVSVAVANPVPASTAPASTAPASTAPVSTAKAESFESAPALSTATAYAMSSPDGDRPFVSVPDTAIATAEKQMADKTEEKALPAPAPRVVMQPVPEDPKAGPVKQPVKHKANAAPRALAAVQEKTGPRKNPEAQEKASARKETGAPAKPSAPQKPAPKVKLAKATEKPAAAKSAAKPAAKVAAGKPAAGNAIPALRLSANAY